MNKLFKDKTLEYVSFLQKFINDLYSGKKELDKDECQDIDECLRGLRDVLYIFDNVISTTCLDSFNGNYDMTVSNTEYYMDVLSDRYNLKCIKDKKLPRWTVIKGDKKYIFTCHYSGPKDTNNDYNNFISLDYVYPSGKHYHVDLQSFNNLNSELQCISNGYY